MRHAQLNIYWKDFVAKTIPIQSWTSNYFLPVYFFIYFNSSPNSSFTPLKYQLAFMAVLLVPLLT